MNKRACVFLCMAALLWICAGSILTQADEQQASGVSVEELIDRWEREGYPDYAGGACKNGDGTQWVFCLKDNTEENQETVKRELSSGNNITFQKCPYSHNELIPIRDQIIQEYITAGITSVKVVDIRCQIWGDEESAGPRVVVSLVNSNGYLEWITLFSQKYGDKVVVGSWSELMLFVPAITPAPSSTPAAGPKSTPKPGREDKGKSASPVSIKIKDANRKGNNLTITWSKVSQADKYQIKISRNKNLAKAQKVICPKPSYQYRINKKTGSQIYMKVRVHYKDSRKWGGWSKKLKIKCK